MTKKAFTTAIARQACAYLAKLALEKGYRVLGADRRRSREVRLLDYVEISDAVERVDELGIDTKTGNIIVHVTHSFFCPAEVGLLLGSPSRVENELGWSRKVSFAQLVEFIVRTPSIAAGAFPSALQKED